MERTTEHIFTLNTCTIARFVVNGLRENTYVLHDASGMGIVIDCGVRRETKETRIANYITNNNIKPTLLLITHAHFDHLWGAQWFYDTFGILPTIPPLEQDNYRNAEQNMHRILHRPLPLPLPDNPLILDPTKDYGPLSCIATPGHTHGSMCFYHKEEGVLFSGDTIFKNYIGLPKEEGITLDQVQQTIQDKILTLPQGTLVLPGHGPEFYL